MQTVGYLVLASMYQLKQILNIFIKLIMTNSLTPYGMLNHSKFMKYHPCMTSLYHHIFITFFPDKPKALYPHITRIRPYLDGLMQKRCNSIADALESHLFCIKPWIWIFTSCLSLVCFWALSLQLAFSSRVHTPCRCGSSRYEVELAVLSLLEVPHLIKVLWSINTVKSLI